MVAILRDSVIAIAIAIIVVHTCPRAILLAMITIRKSIHGCPFVSYMGIRLHLVPLWAAKAPLLNKRHMRLADLE